MGFLNENEVQNIRREHFLELFPPKDRSLVANRFLQIIRSGESDPIAVVWGVHNRITKSPYIIKRNEKILVKEILNNFNLATEYAEHLIEWENLPYEKREAIKNERSKKYKLLHMTKLPPTEKQIRYLRSMGFTGPVFDRAEASEKIDKLFDQVRYYGYTIVFLFINNTPITDQPKQVLNNSVEAASKP